VAHAYPSSDVRLAALDLLGDLAQHAESAALLALRGLAALLGRAAPR
jgi:hypothetical protein